MKIPERIGKYPISEVLGQGAMGVVYKAFDPHIHRPVAIKTIHKELLGDNTAQDSIAARFRNEAQAVGRIAHPGVVAIYEFGEDESTAYIAMEFVEGRNLEYILAATPMLPEAQVLHIMDQLLDALAAAHAQGVWHRDIKPGNLILTTSGQVKLADFGIARIESAGLTSVASMIGTPGYMAPEQYTGEGIDHRSDLFACGVLLYRLLTGRAPFNGTPEVVMYKIMNEQPVAPCAATQGARPSAYDTVVARALAKQADQRFQSAQAMRQALRDVALGTARVGASPSSADADATVIGTPLRPPQAPPISGNGTRVSTASGATALAVPAGWDAIAVTRIERALATYVGPMAKVMLRAALRDCLDVESLVTAVSRHIPDEARRREFLSVVGTRKAVAADSSVTPEPGTPAGAAVATTSVPSAATTAPPLTDDFQARVLQLLAHRMGPIARVVAKRAAAQCGGTQARFVQLVLEGSPEGERAALRQALDALG